MPDPSPQASRAAARPAPDPLVALADRCVQCGLCLPHCPTYALDRSEAESPRGRINYARALATGTLEASPAGDLHLDHCLGCRRCETACPAGVAYGELLLVARARQFRRSPPALRSRLAAWWLARPRPLAWWMAAYQRFWPVLPRRWRPLPRPPAGSATPVEPSTDAPTALFLGCIARAYEAPARAALVQLLAVAGMAARTPAGQTCCGAAAANLGDVGTADDLARCNRAALAGHATVLCIASGCRDHLAASLAGAALVADPLVLLAASEKLRFRATDRRVALHLPCSQGDSGALRRLLARVPGLDLVVLPDRGCCGAAGLHQASEPARAAALREPLLTAVVESGASELLSTNIGCRLHLANGCPLPVRHPLEFLAEHLA